MSLAPSNGVFNDSPPTVPTISLSHFTHQPRRLVTRSGRLSTTTFLFFPHTLVHRLYYQPHTTLIHYSAREREGEGRESQPLPRYPVDGFYPFNPGVGWRKILFWHLFMVFFYRGERTTKMGSSADPRHTHNFFIPSFFFLGIICHGGGILKTTSMMMMIHLELYGLSQHKRDMGFLGITLIT